MATDYLLPDLGEDIEEAEVIAVHVRAGDHVELEQAVIEVETEKANLDVPAPYAGAITAVHVSVGDMVKPARRSSRSRARTARSLPPRPRRLRPQRPQRQRLRPAPHSPPPPLRPGRPPAAPARPPAVATPVLPSDGGQVPASPSVRMFAREIGWRSARYRDGARRAHLDRGREGARTADAQRAAPAEEPARAPAPASSLPDLSQFGEIERERMSGVRRTTARTLSQSWAQSPHVMLQRKADVTELEALRRANRERVTAAGGALTMMPILIKVVAGALREFPRLQRLDRCAERGDRLPPLRPRRRRDGHRPRADRARRAQRRPEKHDRAGHRDRRAGRARARSQEHAR